VEGKVPSGPEAFLEELARQAALVDQLREDAGDLQEEGYRRNDLHPTYPYGRLNVLRNNESCSSCGGTGHPR